MSTTSDFNDTSVSTYRLKRLEQLAHTMRRSLHRTDDLVFMPASVLRLAFLISKLPFERPAGKLLPPSHFSDAFCGLERLNVKADIHCGRRTRQRVETDQLRTCSSILAHIRRRDFSSALNRDRLRQLSRDFSQPREVGRAEILNYNRISARCDSFLYFTLARNFRCNSVEITQLLLRCLYSARDAAENRNMI